ncbi:MAG: phosphotransferase [Chloroflexota bacterium]|nr:phosphotransferase [Chloroflexota bacterium]
MPESPLDPFAILAALGLATPARATPVLGGADTALWRVEAHHRVYALRVLRPDQAGQAQRELAAMTAASAGGVPAPGVHAVGTWQDHPVIVLEWRPGQTLLRAVERDPSRAREFGLAFGRALAAIHALPAPAALVGGTSWIEWASPDAALRARLLDLTGRREVLLHLDYHPLNVLVDDERVTAVLDWANARTGDPRADLARTISLLSLAPAAPALPPATWVAARRALMTGTRDGYRAIAGPQRQMAPFLAWAGMVMERDLTPRLDRPDLPWLTAAYLDQVRTWTARWRARAGIPG